MPQVKLSPLAHKALLGLQMLGRLSVAPPELRRELIDGGFAVAHADGKHLQITDAGRRFIAAYPLGFAEPRSGEEAAPESSVPEE